MSKSSGDGGHVVAVVHIMVGVSYIFDSKVPNVVVQFAFFDSPGSSPAGGLTKSQTLLILERELRAQINFFIKY